MVSGTGNERADVYARWDYDLCMRRLACEKLLSDIGEPQGCGGSSIAQDDDPPFRPGSEGSDGSSASSHAPCGPDKQGPVEDVFEHSQEVRAPPPSSVHRGASSSLRCIKAALGECMAKARFPGLPPHTICPDTCYMVPQWEGWKWRPRFDYNAYASSVMVNDSHRRQSRRRFLGSLSSSSSSSLGGAGGGFCGVPRHENVVMVPGTTMRQLFSCVRDELLPLYAYQVRLLLRAEKRAGLRTEWDDCYSSGGIPSIPSCDRDVLNNLTKVAWPDDDDYDDDGCEDGDRAGCVFACSMNWRFHYLMARSAIMDAVVRRVRDSAGERGGRLLSGEEADALCKSVCNMLRATCFVQHAGDHGDDFRINVYFVRSGEPQCVSVILDNDEDSIQYVPRFSNVPHTPSRVAWAAGARAVKGIDAMWLDSCSFEDSCEHCQGEPSPGQACHEGPLWAELDPEVNLCVKCRAPLQDAVPRPKAGQEGQGGEGEKEEGMFHMELDPASEAEANPGGSDAEMDSPSECAPSIFYDESVIPVMQLPPKALRCLGLADDICREMERLVFGSRLSGLDRWFENVRMGDNKFLRVKRWVRFEGVQVECPRDTCARRNGTWICAFLADSDSPFEEKDAHFAAGI